MEGVIFAGAIPLAAIIAGEEDRPSADRRSNSPHPHLHRLRSETNRAARELHWGHGGRNGDPGMPQR
jgi:hypothetical protein